jgi:hypothetical protein
MITVKRTIHFQRESRGQKRIVQGSAPEVSRGRVPRISRLMALAIRFERLIREAVIVDQSELARLTHVTQPRITQIMNLLHLAAGIQEALLFLPPVLHGRDPLTERDLRPIVTVCDWRKQQDLWKRLLACCEIAAHTDS